MKLTAISISCNGKKLVKFVMLPTHRVVRMGWAEYLPVLPQSLLNRWLDELGAHRGSTISIG